ncbi:uncharacterized protein [Henckelia pumila]|uniref:uncharacterized protein n=1 Tax=Henckelia pumila TaxID=405737 RepID=UPI003C6E5864
MEKITNAGERGRPELRWMPPSSCLLKLNVDAAVNEDMHLYSISGVVRDNQGRLLLAFGKQLNQPISLVHGELLAIGEGIKLLYDRGFSDIQVATDSLLAVQAVTSGQEDIGYIGLFAAEIRERQQRHMNDEFPFWLVRLVIEDVDQ